MYSLIHFKAIGTNKCDIFAKLISLGVFEPILPKTTIVHYGSETRNKDEKRVDQAIVSKKCPSNLNLLHL